MHKCDNLVPFPVIVSAINGDADSINAILRKYEGYINCLSARKFYDENGNVCTVVDEEIRRMLETKLITKILQFKIML